MQTLELKAVDGLQPVALVGISAALPSGSHSSKDLDFKAFCEFLSQKKDAYESIPSDRFNAKAWKGNSLGQVVTDKGCFLKDISLFDHVEFGVSSKDAVAMALSSRKLLELSFLALLDSGIDYRSKNVGCFMSAVNFDMLSISEPDEFLPRGSFGGIPCMIANRISYHLDLLGPSIPLDTACSSTSTALHLAVQALRSGDCSAALVGGCQLNHRLLDWLVYSQGSVLAPDGKSKPFDASADGFSRGEGAIVIVLKLLEDAVRDGDHIYATVLGTGINQCGAAAPIGAPVAKAQQIAMERAYAQSGRSPKDVDFIELHATGTAAGDPTEANWVGKKFQRDDELLVGSVKGNIGHLEITAFLASLLKVCSIFKTRFIPPNTNFTSANPAIKWDEYKLRVPLELTPIPTRCPSKKTLVSIASSGIGGSNGHAVLEAPPVPETDDRSSDSNDPVLLLAAGLSPRSVEALADSLTQIVLKTDVSQLPTLSAIMSRRARQMTWRSAAVYCPGEDESPQFSSPATIPRTRSPVVFVFSGQGPQHIAMGRQLYTSYDVFRNSVDEMDETFMRLTGDSLISTYGLFGGSPTIDLPSIWPISVTLPAITVVQVALVDLLQSVGIAPDIVLGHSAGETAMLYASCGATKRMVVQLAVARGRAFSEVENSGGVMAAVSCTVEEAEAIISSATEGDPAGKVEIGCFNASESVTLSGLNSYVEKSVAIATERGIYATKLRTRVPVHSSLLESCWSTYTSLVNDAFAAHPSDYVPSKTTYSTLTGERWTEQFTPEYFWKSARNPVRFAGAMAALLRETPNATFVEIGPHPVLSSYITSHFTRHSSNVVTCPMRRKRNGGTYDESRHLLGALGDLVVAGLNTVNLAALYGLRNLSARDVELPEYPFARKHVPYRSETSSVVSRQLGGRRGPLGGPNLRMNALTHPILAQHIIKGEPIMPAAGYLEMAFEYGAQQLRNVKFHSILSLSAPNPVAVNFKVDGIHWSIFSDSGDNSQRLHSSGFLFSEESQNPPECLNICSLKNRCESVSLSGFYESFASFASYGPAFQRVVALYKGEDEFLVQMRGADSDLYDLDGYVMHPAILDSCIHISVHKLSTNSVDNDVYYLPSRIKTVSIHALLKQGLPANVFVHSRFQHWRPDGLTYDFTVTNEEGVPLMTLQGFEVAKHSSRLNNGIVRRFDVLETPLSIKIPSDHALMLTSRRGGAMPYHTIHLMRGHEMDMQEALLRLDQNSPNLIWICVTSGLNGAAARGLSRSIRKEIPAWTIRLVLFPENWKLETRDSAILYLSSLHSDILEQELTVYESGSTTSPRFEVSKAPERYVLRHNMRWEVVGYPSRSLSYSCRPLIPEGSFLVEVEYISEPKGGLRGFYGEISFGTYKGTKVLGVTEQPLSNYVLVPEGWAMKIEHQECPVEKSLLPSLALGSLIAGYALGLTTLAQPERGKDMQILILGSDEAVSSSLTCILSMLGIKHRTIKMLSLDQLETISSFNLVISNLVDKGDIQLVESALPAHASLVLWSDPVSGILSTLRKQPWLPNDTMTIVLRRLIDHCRIDTNMTRSVSPVEMLDALRLPPEAISQSLFDASRVYLLIGGVGSLGVHIALWMYQRGARKLVLTSRHGKNSTSFTGLATARRILSYLESLDDLDIRVACCDATSLSETKALLESIMEPIAGCMLLAVTLSDRSFFLHSEESYSLPFSKVKAFRVLEKTIDINDLDFMIAYSSVTTFGNAGQTNYTAANMLLEESTRPYARAFSMILPLILDSNVNTNEGRSTPKFGQLSTWAMTTEELYKYIEDGILKLEDGPFGLYIPDFDWNEVHKHMGPSYLYDHLVDQQSDEEQKTIIKQENPAETIGQILRDRLGVSEGDFSSKVPLTSYGLDSLSAAQISFALKPFMTVSQIQLLANVCLDDLLSRLPNQDKTHCIDPTTHSSKGFDWTKLNASGQTVVKLVDVEGNPLILLHGVSGTILAFKPLQDRFTTPLWAIQSTPETPLDSVEATSQFYFQEIKKLKPEGPYRLGGYCATSIVAFRLAMLFEAGGDVVEEFVMIEHFPLLFCTWNFDEESIKTGLASRELIREGFLLLANVYAKDKREDMGKEYLNIFDGVITKSNASEHVGFTFEVVKSYISSTANFLLALASGDPSSLRDRLTQWIRGLKAPLTVYVATEGMLACLPAHTRADWEDLGARSCSLEAKVITVNKAHFSILESEDFVDDIHNKLDRHC